MVPFDYQHPVTGDLFVDREQEIADLQDRLERGANCLVIAPRRLGKSSLIQQAFAQAQGYRGIYVTCPIKGTGHDLAEEILAQVALPLSKRVQDWFVKQAQTLRPVAVYGPSGTWRFTFDRLEPPQRVLSQTIGLLDSVAKRLGTRIVLAIDEVQRILERDPEAFHALRDVVQFQTQVGYVLSGSKFHVLERLLDAENPFGHQLTPLYVGGIPIDDFAPLATRIFSEAHNHLSEATLERVGAICRGNPKRTQELLFDLTRVDRPAPEDAERAALSQVEAQHHLMEDLLDQVKLGVPMDVLVALAAAPQSPPVYGHEFVQTSGAKSPAHVRAAVESLTRRGLIDQKHRFVDPYLRIYLRTRDASVADRPFA